MEQLPGVLQRVSAWTDAATQEGPLVAPSAMRALDHQPK
jgi:hypothetical protein